MTAMNIKYYPTVSMEALLTFFFNETQDHLKKKIQTKSILCCVANQAEWKMRLVSAELYICSPGPDIEPCSLNSCHETPQSFSALNPTIPPPTPNTRIHFSIL